MRNKVLFAAMLAATTAHADAALVRLNFDLNATSFNGVAPVDPVVGRFSFEFDNSGDFGPTSEGVKVSGFNLASPVKIAYWQEIDVLSVGTQPGVGSYTLAQENDFGFFIFSASGEYSKSPSFSYRASSQFFDGSAVLTPFVPTVPEPGASVPEPAAWALMIIGFGLSGAAVRRRARTTVTYA